MSTFFKKKKHCSFNKKCIYTPDDKNNLCVSPCFHINRVHQSTFLTAYPIHGCRDNGANPSCHRVEAGCPLDRPLVSQLFPISFTPMGNLESPINLMCIFFEWWWEACGFRKSQLFKIYKYIFTSQTFPLPRSNPSITT